jgi:hypothetical protein
MTAGMRIAIAVRIASGLTPPSGKTTLDVRHFMTRPRRIIGYRNFQ